VHFKNLFFVFLLICFQFRAYAVNSRGDGHSGPTHAGSYSGLISAGSGHKVDISITLDCLIPANAQSCSMNLIRTDGGSNGGLKYQAGALGTCDTGGHFETAWVSSSITCGKGGSATCTGCLLIQLTCTDLYTGKPFLPDPIGMITGDCP